MEMESDLFLKTYPNPACQTTIISYMVNQPGRITISLASFTGQSVRTLYAGESPAGEVQEMEVGLGGLQPGVYMLILRQADGNVITEKLIIQR